MTIPALPGLSRLLDQLADGVLLLDARGVVEFASEPVKESPSADGES
jgi:hypothetical protein